MKSNKKYLDTKYNVVILIDAEVHQHHVEHDVTLAYALAEAKRQAEYIGTDSLEKIEIIFKRIDK